MTHLIGFSHHYSKICGQTHGILLSVRSTKPIENRPDSIGIEYDTTYYEIEQVPFVFTLDYPPQFVRNKKQYPLNKEDFDKPMLQLVFLGNRQIPFTTYREFPENYQPIIQGSMTYNKNIPYSDLVGEDFVFKFKGEKIPNGLLSSYDKDRLERGKNIKIFQ